MEDAFWEAPYNSSYQDEYFLIKSDSTSPDFFTKQETLFNNTLRLAKDTKLKSGLLSKSVLSDNNINSQNLHSLPIFSEETIMDPKLTNLTDFNSFSNEILVDNLEDVYESSKYINYLYYAGLVTTSNNN